MSFKNFIAEATLIKTIAALALFLSYSFWLFAIDTKFSDAMTATGGLPETAPGFHSDLPAKALTALGETKNDYITFQFLDIPFAFLNALVLAFMIAIGLRALGEAPKIFQTLLSVPALGLIAEIVEDALLVGMTMGAIPMSGASALIQQCATLLKFGSIFVATPIALIGFLFAIGKAITNSTKKT